MILLAWAILTLLLAMIIHVGIWRWRLPRYQTKTLLAIFVSCTIGSVVALAFAGRLHAFDAIQFAPSLPQYCQLVLFTVAFALAYVISYSAIEAESPTLVIVRALAAAGGEGLSHDDIRRLLPDQVLVTPRLDDLVRDGMMVRDASHFQLTPKGRRFVTIFILFRKMLGLPRGG